MTRERCALLLGRPLRTKADPTTVLNYRWHNLGTPFHRRGRLGRLCQESHFWIFKETGAPCSEIMGRSAFWELGRGQLLPYFLESICLNKRNQVFWIADVCLEAGPEMSTHCPLTKAGRSCRKAGLGCNATAGGGWLHVALGSFQRLQGDPGERWAAFAEKKRTEVMTW